MREVCEYLLNEMDILSLTMYDMCYVIAAPVTRVCVCGAGEWGGGGGGGAV